MVYMDVISYPYIDGNACYYDVKVLNSWQKDINMIWRIIVWKQASGIRWRCGVWWMVKHLSFNLETEPVGITISIYLQKSEPGEDCYQLHI